MDQVKNTIKKETYIKCKRCNTEIYQDTHKKMTSCKCGAVEVDGCGGYTRIIGKDVDYELLYK